MGRHNRNNGANKRLLSDQQSEYAIVHNEDDYHNLLLW